MRGLKNAVFRLQSKITSLKKALTILIDDDEAMALMNLSILRTNPDLYKYVIYFIFLCFSCFFLGCVRLFFCFFFMGGIIRFVSSMSIDGDFRVRSQNCGSELSMFF